MAGAAGLALSPAFTRGARAASPLVFQASWVNDSEFLGYFVAFEEGFYKKEGLEVTYVSGGPDVIPESTLISGSAQIALTAIETTIPAIVDQGAKLKIIGTQYQKNPIGVVSLAKKWDFGLEAYGSFTYQDVWDQAAVTSSVASSNYTNTAYLDANGGAFGHSNDEVRYSFHYSLGYQHAFYRDYKTTISLFGETRIGSPYSYTMQDAGTLAGRSQVFGTAGNTSRFLFYVPTGLNDPLVTGTAADLARIDQIINSTDLKKYRGKIAPRNAFNSKWFSKIDLHLEQEIPTFVGKSRISVF
eukprot:gene29970-33842_t